MAPLDRLETQDPELVHRQVYEEEPSDDAQGAKDIGGGSIVENPSAIVTRMTNSMPLAPSITRNPCPMPWRAVSDRINSCTGPGAAPRAAPSAKAGATCSLQALTSEALRCLARQVGRRLVRWCEAQLLDADRPVVATAHEDALTFPEGLDLHAREAEAARSTNGVD